VLAAAICGCASPVPSPVLGPPGKALVPLAASPVASPAVAPSGPSAPESSGAGSAVTQPSTPLDGSYDWHTLIVVPLGTALKGLPFAVHETLLFHDPESAATAADEQECFSREGAAPRFIGVPADEFVLCFHQDRLVRIEAGAPPPAAPGITFERLCDRWLSGAETIARGPQACEGRDHDLVFRAHVDETAGSTEASDRPRPAWILVIHAAVD
jgi:hypothetical protein